MLSFSIFVCIHIILLFFQLYRKGIKVTVVCPGPIKTSSTPEASTSSTKLPAEVSISVPGQTDIYPALFICCCCCCCYITEMSLISSTMHLPSISRITVMPFLVKNQRSYWSFYDFIGRVEYKCSGACKFLSFLTCNLDRAMSKLSVILLMPQLQTIQQTLVANHIESLCGVEALQCWMYLYFHHELHESVCIYFQVFR